MTLNFNFKIQLKYGFKMCTLSLFTKIYDEIVMPAQKTLGILFSRLER
jgi:hypothetical protein